MDEQAKNNQNESGASEYRPLQFGRRMRVARGGLDDRMGPVAPPGAAPLRGSDSTFCPNTTKPAMGIRSVTKSKPEETSAWPALTLTA